MMTAEQLKNSILQLAMQGRLVEQRSEEGTGEQLFQEIQLRKKELITEGRIKKNKKFKDSISSEIPFDIPGTWKWVKFGSVMNVVSARRVHQSDWKNNGIPFYRAREIAKIAETGFVDNELYISEELYREFARSGVPEPGDLMVTGVGTLGKTYVVKEGDKFYYKDASVLCFENYAKLDPYYIKVIMESPLMKGQIKSNSSGTTVATLTMVRMVEYLIPLPPLEEQKRIVAKIEELMPFVEQYAEASTKLNTLNTSFPDMMKKSILQEAVQGKLVPQDPNDEPASELLKRIAEEKQSLIKEGKIKKQKALPEITEDEIPFDIPESWEWEKLGNLLQINPRNIVDDTTIVGFMPMPLLEAGYVNSYSYEERKWEDVKKGFTHFAEGDIVVAKITPCFQNRKSAVITDIPNGYGAGTTELHVLRDNTKILFVEYLLLICKTEHFINEGKKHFTGTAGQQRVGKNFIENYLIPVPPLNEQKRIVSRVKELLPLIDSTWIAG